MEIIGSIQGNDKYWKNMVTIANNNSTYLRAILTG